MADALLDARRFIIAYGRCELYLAPDAAVTEVNGKLPELFPSPTQSTGARLATLRDEPGAGAAAVTGFMGAYYCASGIGSCVIGFMPVCECSTCLWFLADARIFRFSAAVFTRSGSRYACRVACFSFSDCCFTWMSFFNSF